MRALVIDDEQLILEALNAFLRISLPDLTLDIASDVEAALRLAATVRFDLVLLDWHLVGTDGERVDGRSVVEALRRHRSTAPILVVSGDDPAAWTQQIFELGLAGFVPKSASGATFLDAIQCVLQGGVFLPAERLNQRAQAASRRHAPAHEAPDADLRERFPELTERQADVLRVMVRGASDKQIGRELGISETTVKTHVRNILDIVGVRRRGEAVFEVTGRGLP